MQTIKSKLRIIDREAELNQEIQDVINCELDKLLKLLYDFNKMQDKLMLSKKYDK